MAKIKHSYNLLLNKFYSYILSKATIMYMFSIAATKKN